MLDKIKKRILSICLTSRKEVNMKYLVNENCIGCGLCNATCPDIFLMTEDGTAEALDVETDAANEDSAQEAMHGCPVDAIEERE